MSESWREADTGYIVYNGEDSELLCGYSPDGLGMYFYLNKAEMLDDVSPRQIVRVGIATWQKHYE